MLTQRFSVGSGVYTKIVYIDFFRKWWWSYMLAIIASISLISLNVNFVFVLLTLVFIVFPMSLSFVFFSGCLVKEVRWSMLPKIMETEENGLRLSYDEFSHRLAWEDIDDYRFTSKFLVLKLVTKAHFIIPYSAFNSNADLQILVKAMNEHISKHRLKNRVCIR